MFVNVDNSIISDNPYYFYNDKSPRTPDAQTSSRGFSIFKRRNSKGNSPRVAIPEKIRTINSANLDTTATVALGSPRGSFGSLGSSYSGGSSLHHQSFEMSSPSSAGSNIFRRPNTAESFRDRLGSYNETAIVSAEADDFFNASPLSKNHHTLPSTGIRRHSFGNFHNRGTSERSHNKSAPPRSPDEVPNMFAPRPPVVTPSKYRGSSRKRDNCGIGNSGSGSPSANMDDILIITAKHSERAILRANFLKNHFDKITKQRGRKPFNFLHIKIEDGPFSEEIAKKYYDTALQIVILCPALLAVSHSYLMSQLSSILRIDKVLGILLDVTEEKVLEFHKSALPSFRRWRRCVVRDNDQSQIGNILGIATDILGRALCQRPPCAADMNASQTKTFSSCSEGFTVLPRKVKIGQNKVVAMLAEPLEKDDVLKIAVEKSGELIEVRNFKQRNPYTLQFTIPESCMEISTMIEIRIEKNERSLGCRPIKCESRLRELEQLLRIEDSPIEFMCHSLGIGPTDRDSLDLHLLQCFQKNMPPNFHLLTGPFDKHNHFLTVRESSPEEYPTLLHFAARWGLDRLAIQLMECPGGETACGIRNCTGKTPAELADQEGYHKLAQSINSFSEFHELTTMYHYFKGISGSSCSSSTNAAAANGKGTTKVVIEAVKSSPAVTCESPKNRLTSAKQVVLTKQKSQDDGGEYMEMSSNSDRENSPLSSTMAVSNLNYISVEAEDDNLQGSSGDVTKDFKSMKIITEAEMTTSELRISEPPYYQSDDKNKSTNLNVSPYQTDKFSQECSNLLENCTNPSMDYVLQPSNIPVVAMGATITSEDDDGNYLLQPSNKPVIEPLWSSSSSPAAAIPQECFQSRSNLNRMGSQSRLGGGGGGYGTLKRTASDASSTRGNPDDELAEIMYDFKNNVLSIRDVEQLVEKWKHRNDVKQSFREKQEQIDLLRKEYERIQEQVKTNLKRETPFEKIKKLFSRHKTATASHSSADKSFASLDSGHDETKSSINSSSMKSIGQRPISSLSLQSVSSSSSSGRLSTGSACSGTSLGDSGTHSDHEDRRFGACRVGSPGSLMDNYLVPPPPRPVSVLTPSSTPGEELDRLTFPSPMSPNNHNHHRFNTPTSPNPGAAEHYLMFPSNLPVFHSNESLHHTYHNQSASSSSSHSNGYLNTIPESAKESINGNDSSHHVHPHQNNNHHNYQNGVTVQPIKVQDRFIGNNDRSNIIYGKLTKASHTAAAQACSSFKPQPQQHSKVLVVAEVYQNVGSDIDCSTVAAVETNSNAIAAAHTKENNNSLSEDNHNYMNI